VGRRRGIDTGRRAKESFLKTHTHSLTSLTEVSWALIRVNGGTWLIPSEKHMLVFTLACHMSEAT
jgi:hypothetical protein